MGICQLCRQTILLLLVRELLLDREALDGAHRCWQMEVPTPLERILRKLAFK
jgi:hypothetical protein